MANLNEVGLAYFWAKIKTSLNGKANIASPTFTGTPKAPTASKGTNTTQIATTAFVTTAVANKTSVTSATKATQDASGNVITSTYATKTELSGKADQNHTHTDLETRISNIENALKSGSIKTWGDLLNHSDTWNDLI